MKYLPLIWAGLWRKPARTVLTFLSLASAFLLFGSLYGVNAGFDAAIERVNSNRLRVSGLNNDRALLIGYKEEIERIPGVAATMISTEISGYYRERLNLLYIDAIGGDIHLDVFGEIDNAANLVAALRARRTGALIGRDLARRFGWKLGERISIITGPTRNKDGSDFMEFDIVGIYDVPNLPESARWLLLNYDYLEEVRVKALGTVNQFLVDTVDASRNDEVAAAIDRHFENSSRQTYTESERDFQRALVNQAIDMKLVVSAIIVASMFALLVLSANTMMQSVRQRLPEMAVLKTVGYTDNAVAGFVMIEALLLCVSAALLGIFAATLLFPKIAAAIHVPSLSIPSQVPAAGVLVAVIAALVSSVVPAWRTRSLSVASALAGK